ncbi:hypothetical protein ACYRFS_12095 [Listeria kieliensis]
MLTKEIQEILNQQLDLLAKKSTNCSVEELVQLSNTMAQIAAQLKV